jgi:hypothetical protein
MISYDLNVFMFVRHHGGWVTAEFAVGADLSPRTARQHAAAFAHAGLFDSHKRFDGYHYRYNPQEKGLPLSADIEQARAVFSLR